MSLGVWNEMTRQLSDYKFNGILYQMKCIYLSVIKHLIKLVF